MGTTSRGYPTPEGSDNVDIPGDLSALASAINTDVGSVDTAKAAKATTITAGTGLTGGGDLSANRTLSVSYGTTAGTAAQGNDARLSDARTPTAHAASHATGGADPIVSVGPVNPGATLGSNLGNGTTSVALTGLTIGQTYHVQAASGTMTGCTLDGNALTVSGNATSFPASATSHTVALTAGTATAITVQQIAGAASNTPNVGGLVVRAKNTNVAIGSNAQRSLTTGLNNVATGSNAQIFLTTGSFNVATGRDAQYSLTTGLNNVATGSNAQYSLTTGLNNVATGSNAQIFLTTGSFNVAIGSEAQRSLTTGSDNVAIGYFAQRFLTTGSNNVATGRDAGRGFVTGNYNVSVGDGAAYVSQSDVSNTTVFGAGAYTTHAGGIAIGRSAAATTAGEVQIGVKSGGEKPTAMRVGTNRLVTVAELKTVVAGAADFAAFKTAVAAITD